MCDQLTIVSEMLVKVTFSNFLNSASVTELVGVTVAVEILCVSSATVATPRISLCQKNVKRVIKYEQLKA